MSINKVLAQHLGKIKDAIVTYGVKVTILRDIYENESGVRVLKQSGVPITVVDMVLDNSSDRVEEASTALTGIEKPYISAKMYYAYTPTIDIRYGDYFEYQGLIYQLDIPANLANADLVYQVKVKGAMKDGR